MEALLQTLNMLQEVAHMMGLRFNKDKTELYHWAKNYSLEPITWQHQKLSVHPPKLTYLGHICPPPPRRDSPGHGYGPTTP